MCYPFFQANAYCDSYKKSKIFSLKVIALLTNEHNVMLSFIQMFASISFKFVKWKLSIAFLYLWNNISLNARVTRFAHLYLVTNFQMKMSTAIFISRNENSPEKINQSPNRYFINLSRCTENVPVLYGMHLVNSCRFSATDYHLLINQRFRFKSAWANWVWWL